MSSAKRLEVSMPSHQDDRKDDRTSKPSVVDLVTNPEKFDQWQRQREREEKAGRSKESPDRPSE
jgi:hypothetical protein